MAGSDRLDVDRISAAAFERALRQLRQKYPDEVGWQLLGAHYAAPRQTLSWRELGSRIGWTSAEPVKLHYGRFGRLLSRELGLLKPPRGFWLHLVADWDSTPDLLGHTTYRLRPRLAAAFRSLRPADPESRHGDRRVHLLQAGVTNGDKGWLDAVPAGASTAGHTPWVAPRTASPGDAAVIYIRGIGFYAVATISTVPRRRRDWQRRYGAHLEGVHRISPPISLGTIRRRLPTLRWANYPRSIHTLSPKDAARVLRLVTERQRTGLPDRVDAPDLSLEELRATAIAASKRNLPALLRQQTYRQRSEHVRRYVLMRADGVCEGCGEPAPFARPDGSPYLEPHHLTKVADDGPDHPAHVAALCPTCHRRVHHGATGDSMNRHIAESVRAKERG